MLKLRKVVVISLAALLAFQQSNAAESSTHSCFFAMASPNFSIDEIAEPLRNITFGPEFTFSNHEITKDYLKAEKNKQKLIATPVARLYFRKILVALRERCRDKKCRIKAGQDKHGDNITVTFPDGWYFNVSFDEAVLEVQTRPETVESLRTVLHRIQKEIFDLFIDNDLKPYFSGGGGNIHVGNDIFQKYPDLFRDFFVDYANYPELTNQLFGAYHDMNSPPFAAFPDDVKLKFKEELKKYDSLPDHKRTYDKFISLVTQHLYYMHPYFIEVPYPRTPFSTAYYQAIRLATGLPTIEMRAFVAQTNAWEYLMQVELLLLRLNNLFKKDTRVELDITKNTYLLKATDLREFLKSYLQETTPHWNNFMYLWNFPYTAEAHMARLKSQGSN